MSEFQIRPSRNVPKADFERYAKDLELFLGAFTPQLLAEWLNKDKGNISRKLHGNEAITRNDIRDFYSKLSSVVAKLKKGINSFEIELEMEDPTDADRPVVKNLWEEIRLIHEKMGQFHLRLIELQDRIKKS
jgi:hypothetical protein